MNDKTLSFPALCKYMRLIRGLSGEQLGQACMTEEGCIRYVEEELLAPTPLLERRIRQALHMPRTTDKLLSMVYYAEFNEDAYDNPDPSLATPAPASQPAEQAVPSPKGLASPTQAPPTSQPTHRGGPINKDGTPRKPWGSNRSKPQPESQTLEPDSEPAAPEEPWDMTPALAKLDEAITTAAKPVGTNAPIYIPRNEVIG